MTLLAFPYWLSLLAFHFYRRLERLEREFHMIAQGLRRIEASLGDESARRDILTRDLLELKQQMAALQSRIEDIEARLAR